MFNGLGLYKYFFNTMIHLIIVTVANFLVCLSSFTQGLLELWIQKCIAQLWCISSCQWEWNTKETQGYSPLFIITSFEAISLDSSTQQIKQLELFPPLFFDNNKYRWDAWKEMNQTKPFISSQICVSGERQIFAKFLTRELLQDESKSLSFKQLRKAL